MKQYHDIVGDGGSNVVHQVAEHARQLRDRMASIRHTVAVMSGKGGVGKSSLTVNLAAALATEGYAVGILDADLNGPSIAKMTGVRKQPVGISGSGIRPAVSTSGLRVMSMDLFLLEDDTPLLWDAPTQKDAYAWRGLMEAAALREFLSDTEWGALDILLIDLPPGSDKLPNLADALPTLSGAVVITIPSAVSALVVQRSVSMARELLKTPIIGVIENMSSFVCPHCGQEEPMFTGVGADQLATECGIPFLGRIPFDPRIAASADEGIPFVGRYTNSPTEQAFRHAAAEIAAFLNLVPALHTPLELKHGGLP